VKNEHLSRVLEHRGDVACNDVLALADADDQRRVLARCHDGVRVVDVDHSERVAAVEPAYRPADRRGQITLVVRLHQVGDGLGVGLAAQYVTGRCELLAKLHVVLDDAVVHDRDPARAVGMGMSVLLAGPAVRGPAGVTDADAADNGRLGNGGAQIHELAEPANHDEPAIAHDRDPGRVVAAVLEPGESADEDVARLTRADVSDDSTHAFCARGHPQGLSVPSRPRSGRRAIRRTLR
jgi:hypothetical protein